MRAILYIGHGSRTEAGRKQFVSWVEQLQARVPLDLQDYCFLELAKPDIAEGVRRLAARGATEIACVPILLFSAGHHKIDIPLALQQAFAPFPGLRLAYGRPIGPHPRMVRIVKERIAEVCDSAFDGRTEIVLVGRGSSDPQQIRGLEQIALCISERVRTAYLAAASPSFSEMLETLKGRRAIVVPYLFFTGVLLEEMKNLIQAKNAAGESFVLTKSLSGHPLLWDVVQQRVAETLAQLPASSRV